MQVKQRNQGSNHGSPRIPLALQAVFLDGNRGIVVDAPPADKSAMKTFFRWRWWGRSVSNYTGIVEKKETQTIDIKPPIEHKRPRKKKPASMPTLSPQQYLDAMIRSRGYSAATYSTLSSAYHNKPTPYQLASYGVYVINLIRNSNIEGLQEVLDAGLSPNACNAHGESIVHNVCRRCDVQVLNVLLDAGCEIQISDDNGRTPLHDACWAPEPNFPLVEKLLERDIRLLYMADSHGHLPLSYTRQDHWSEWLQFLQSKKDLYWPRNTSNDSAPAMALLEPHSRPIPNPENALSIQLALMVAGGKVKPKEASLLRLLEEEERSPDVGSDDDDDDDDYDDDDTDSSYDSDDDSESCSDFTEPETSLTNEFESSWDVKEMNEVLESLDSPIKRPLVW